MQQRKVLSEEDYGSSLSQIIQRDYYPDVPELERQLAVAAATCDGAGGGGDGLRAVSSLTRFHAGVTSESNNAFVRNQAAEVERNRNKILLLQAKQQPSSEQHAPAELKNALYFPPPSLQQKKDDDYDSFSSSHSPTTACSSGSKKVGKQFSNGNGNGAVNNQTTATERSTAAAAVDQEEHRLMPPPPPAAVASSRRRNEQQQQTKKIEPAATRFSRKKQHEQQDDKVAAGSSRRLHLEGSSDSEEEDDDDDCTTDLDTPFSDCTTDLDTPFSAPIEVERRKYAKMKRRELQTLIPVTPMILSGRGGGEQQQEGDRSPIATGGEQLQKSTTAPAVLGGSAAQTTIAAANTGGGGHEQQRRQRQRRQEVPFRLPRESSRDMAAKRAAGALLERSRKMTAVGTALLQQRHKRNCGVTPTRQPSARSASALASALRSSYGTPAPSKRSSPLVSSSSSPKRPRRKK